MIRKFLCSASLAGMLFSGVAVHARTTQQESQPKRQNEQAKSVNGKVTNIASDKKSFGGIAWAVAKHLLKRKVLRDENG